MKVVIDLDQHAAIQDFGVAAPAGTYEWKSQDTIDFQVYFVRSGIVQDLGAGMALKFGTIATGDTTDTILAYQTTFTYQTDSAGNIYYLGQVVFNTSQMASAITGKTQLPCTSEIRWQTSDNEIIHSLNISSIVFPTILTETGITPPNVSTGYPDASTLELLVHKNAASGYAGLNASGLLFASALPVDGQTIVVNGAGKLASASILATTAANFTTPAANATVSVTFVSTSGLVAGQYIRIPIAGYYAVTTVTDATHAVLSNVGDASNAVAGTTITSGAVLLPAQAVSGGGGTAGQNAYTQTTAAFTVPAIGATVAVTVASTAWMGGSGYWVFINGAGYYAVNSITDATHVVLTNGGSASNATVGSSVPSGATVSAAGPQGAAGASGQGLAAYDALTAGFTMPNAGASVTISIGSTAWVGAGQVLYIATAGYMSVVAISSATQLNVQNLNYPGNASAGSGIASGSHVGPGGPIGPQGAGGPGLNAFTTLAANFVQPAVGSSVSATVANSSWIATGQTIFVQGGGWYSVSSIPDLSHVVLINLGYAGNAVPGATVTSGTSILVSPSGPAGAAGSNPSTTTTAQFTVPAVGSSVSVALVSTAFMVGGANVYIQNAGYFTIASVTDATHAVLINQGATGNVSSGTVINSGAGVSSAGAAGAAGPQGPVGPAGTGGGGIADAPSDNNLYGRKNAAWSVVPPPGIADAPSDGNTYARKNAAWTSFAPGGTGNVNWRGAWNSATAYAVNDAVQRNGSSYICVTANTNNDPATGAGTSSNVGYPTLGASSGSIGGMTAMQVTPSVSGSVASIGIVTSVATTAAVVGIYSDASGAPGTLLGQSAATATIGGPGNNFYIYTLTAPLSLVAGTKYWIVMLTNGSGTAFWDSVAANTVRVAGQAWNAGVLPSTFTAGGTTSATISYSMYVTVTVPSWSIMGAGISADAGNQAVHGSDSLIYVPGGINGFVAKTAAYTLTLGDRNKYIICSGGSWTLTLPSALAGLSYDIRNDMGISGTVGTITIQPPAGTIDGQSSLSLLAGQECKLISDGTNWRSRGRLRSVVLGINDVSAVASASVLLPPGYRYYELEFQDIVLASANNMFMQVSTNGGSTWYATGNYQQTIVYNGSATAVSNLLNSNATNWYITPNAGTSAAQPGQSTIKLYPGDSANSPTFLGNAGSLYTAGPFLSQWIFFSNISVNLGAPVNAVQYTAGGGNFSCKLTVKGIV